MHSHLRVTFALLATSVLLLGTGCTDKKTPMSGVSEKHLMGHKLDVRNYSVDYPIAKWVAVHTYPESFDDNDKRHAWPALGGDKGGDLLDDTTTECRAGEKCIDISTVDYIMSEAPCIWPKDPYYAVVGVCWNATNRGLYFTHKTVHNVKFYAVVESYFGTYGLDDDSTCFRSKCREGRKLYSWTKCRKAVNENYPWHSQITTDAQMALSANPRIRLYHTYYGVAAQSEKANLIPEEKWFRYLRDLVNLQLNERLAEISTEKRDRILAIHERMFREMGERIFADENHDQYLQELNVFFNEVLDEYKTVLTDAEYKAFFGTEKSKIFALPVEH